MSKQSFIAALAMAVVLTFSGIMPANAQNYVLNGTVFDETGAGFVGVSVVVDGTQRGVITDLDGKFSLSVSNGEKLKISFIGYGEQQLEVTGQHNVKINLSPESSSLDEVTVVAYGAQRKASIIGSISTLDSDDLSTTPGQLSSGLAGKLPGVVVMQRSGEPGQGADFWIRGVNTFGANSKPLVIVDGIERDMDLVDADDIASFSILKDATATALYGVRGANGIVIITTKRGSEAAPKINIKAEYGMSQPVKVPRMADITQWLDFYDELYRDAGSVSPITEEERAHYINGDNPDLYPAVDWMQNCFKDFASTGRVNVNVSGGTRRVRYFVGGTYYTEGGIFNVARNQDYNPQISYNKFSIRSNIDIDVTNSTLLNISLSTQNTTNNSPGSDLADIYAHAMYASPIATPPIFSDGTIAGTMALSGYNPYNDINVSGYKNSNYTYAQSLLSLTQDFSDFVTEGLKANIKFSWDASNGNVLRYMRNPTYYYLNIDTPYNPDGTPNYVARNEGTNYLTMTRTNNSTTIINLEASVNYERTFVQDHRVGAMFLFSYRNKTNNVPSNYIYAYPYRNMGIAGRATYSYKDRYFGEFNFGYNGSENFAPGHRYGFFPSFALGYLISNEEFWSPVKRVVNMLKFKASYGVVGNDQIGGNRRFAYNTTMNTETDGATFGNYGQNYVVGITTGEYGNSAVSWEEARKFNAGIEMELFDELSLTADYFYDLRSGIFIQRQSTPSVVGMTTTQYVNMGSMMNQGIDFSANYSHSFSRELTVGATANFSFNRNRKLYDDMPDQVWKYQNLAGFAYDQQFGLIAEGLFESEEDIANWPKQSFSTVRPGDIKYRDINADGIVDSYDMVAIGYTTIPEINYGFGANLTWKGLDVNVFFSGTGNVTRIIRGNNLYGTSSNIQYTGQIFSDVADRRWTLSNQDPNAPYPRLSMSENSNNKQASTYWLRDMSFLRLKTVEIGYNIPMKNVKGISGIRVYVSGNNLLTFSDFKLWDPELEASYGNAYPQMRTVFFGLTLNF